MNNQSTSRRRRHDDNIAYGDKLDACLSNDRKTWVYTKCNGTIAYRLCNKGASPLDAAEIASTIYFDLMDRSVGDVFPRGIPQVDAEWMAFLKSESEYAFLSYYRSSWRHPTSSLDAPIVDDGSGDDDDRSAMTLKDLVPDDSENEYASRPDVRLEQGHVRAAVSLICRRRNYKPMTRRVVEKVFLDDESVADVAIRCHVMANNVSAIKFRFLAALRHDGPAVLAELERLSE